MKAALIGAGSEALHTIKKAQELGVFVIALDGNPAAEGLAAADLGLPVDISDEQAVLDVLKREKPDFVITGPIGRYLTTAGAVNDALGLEGISRQAAVLCTDKYLFHTRLSGGGLRNCRCVLIPGMSAGNCEKTVDERRLQVDNLLAEASDVGYPAILKPRYGSGSRGIFFLEGRDQLREALLWLAGLGEDASPAEEDYVLEEAAPGQEFGVDGAVDREGFHLILLRRKLLTPPPARQAVGYLSVVPDSRENRELMERVRRYMAQTAALLGLKSCLLHADLMIEGEGIFAIEVSARPSGHYLHNVFTPMATGVDMAEAYIRSRCGLPWSYEPLSCRHLLIRYFDLKPGKVKTVPVSGMLQLPEGIRLREWQCAIRPGDVLEPVTTGHSVMGRGYFILEGPSDQKLVDAAERVEGLFEMEV